MTMQIISGRYVLEDWGWKIGRKIDSHQKIPAAPYVLQMTQSDYNTFRKNIYIEANSIRFVRRNTTIPVPDVLDTVPPDGVNNSGLLLTSWIEGETLGSWNQRHLIWPDGFQKHAEIAFYSDSSEERRPALAKIEAMFPEGPMSSPPVNTIAEFHELLFQQVSWTSRLERLRLIAEPVHTRDYRITFTHSDLNPHNILVKDDHLAAIIDWEFAGWYPEYWEYTQLVMQNLHLRPREEFWKRVGFFSGQYIEELKLERALWHSTGDMSIAPGVIPNDYLDQPM
ncbi:kinase-like domain-containing protein [Lentinula detonsa]|uniref:Kinase-like domain-containing protein n=1 Tax=Lentinula detonsa TaxID=2804962 RepID=A0A9W8NSH8_9AGAR|nr:kinase-like domain-containing protein [Lentinula detonsa]